MYLCECVCVRWSSSSSSSSTLMMILQLFYSVRGRHRRSHRRHFSSHNTTSVRIHIYTVLRYNMCVCVWQQENTTPRPTRCSHPSVCTHYNISCRHRPAVSKPPAAFSDLVYYRDRRGKGSKPSTYCRSFFFHYSLYFFFSPVSTDFWCTGYRRRLVEVLYMLGWRGGRGPESSA